MRRQVEELLVSHNEASNFLEKPPEGLAALEAGELDTAKQHAAETLRNNTDRKHWNDGNIIHNTNQILGRCALREGKLADAKDNLLKAGATPGSPQLNTFGPRCNWRENC